MQGWGCSLTSVPLSVRHATLSASQCLRTRMARMAAWERRGMRIPSTPTRLQVYRIPTSMHTHTRACTCARLHARTDVRNCRKPCINNRVCVIVVSLLTTSNNTSSNYTHTHTHKHKHKHHNTSNSICNSNSNSNNNNNNNNNNNRNRLRRGPSGAPRPAAAPAGRYSIVKSIITSYSNSNSIV